MASAERELGNLFADGALEITPDSSESVAAPAVTTPDASAAPALDGTNVPVAPAAPLTPAVPEGGTNTPGPSTSALPDDPAVKKALGIYGDDPVAAAKGFLETNTRNAQMASVLKQLGYDPKTLQPLPQEARPVVEQTPPAPVAVDEATVQASISQLLNQDADYNKLVESYISNDTRLSQLGKETQELEARIAQANLALSIPEIKADSFKVDEYKAVLNAARAEALQLKLEASILEGKQERLNSQASARAGAARTVVTQHYTQQAQTQQEQAELATARVSARAEMATSFPLAIDRAMKQHNIPQDLLEDFKEEARLAGRAYLADDKNDEIKDVFGFVNERAQVFMDRMDRYHRTKSAVYGAAAQARTATATAGVPVAPPAPEALRTQPQSLRSMEADLEREAYVVGKQMGLW